MVCYGSEWGEVLLPTPTVSEPPPPYSPPRSKSKLVPHVHYDHHMSTRETLPKALNHGPSSAFAPPPPRIIKTFGEPHIGYPPPYSSLPSYNEDCKRIISYPEDKKILRSDLPILRHNRGVPNHPIGPVLKVGKSLDLPKKGSLHTQRTAHRHPSGPREKEHPTPKNCEGPKPPLAYVGIAPNTEGHQRSSGSGSRNVVKLHAPYKPREIIEYPKSKSRSEGHGCHDNREPGRGCHDNWEPGRGTGSKRHNRKTCKFDFDTSDKMLDARARPAHASFRESDPLSDYPPSDRPSSDYPLSDRPPSGFSSEATSRLRTYRSLDELSDLLEEESYHLRFGSRSLDDLTEPLYENVSFFTNQRVPLGSNPSSSGKRVRHSSLSSILDGAAPDLPPRRRNMVYPSGETEDESFYLRNFGAYSSGAEGDESDISVQLAKLKEIARVLGVKLQKGELSAPSGRPPSASSSERSRLRNAFAIIDNTLQQSTSRNPPSGVPAAHTSRNPSSGVPGVPARAPVIHDVSFVLNRDQRNLTKEYPERTERYLTKEYSERNLTKEYSDFEEKRGTSLTSCSPETDCISQESGYSSVDSRTYHGKPHRKGDRSTMANYDRLSERECGYIPQQKDSGYYSTQNIHSHMKGSSLPGPTPSHQREIPPLSPVTKVKLPSYSMVHVEEQPHSGRQPHSLPCLKSSTPLQSPKFPKKEAFKSRSLPSKYLEAPSSVPPPGNQSSPPPQSILKKTYRTTHPSIVQNYQESQGENQAQLGIYIKSVVPGGAADQDGRLQAGDQLLSVDGKSLVGISQEEAAQYMVGTGSVVTLEVARQGALYHGLAPLLSQPSPQVTRGIQDPRREPPQHTQSHIQPQPPSHMPSHHPPQQQPHFSHHGQQPRMQSSKSVPALNSDFHHSATKSNSHEVFNPAYSRTSSSTSLTQHQQQPQQQHPHSHQQYPVRSRSTQNLNESSALTLTGRHPSSPALNTEDDRHYQNISFHQGAQDPRMGSQRGGRPPIFPPQSPSGGQDQPRPTSAFMHREDVSMGRGEPLHRPTSQQNLRPDMRYGNEDPRKRPNGLPLSQQVTHMGPGYPPNQNQGMPMNNAPVQRQQYPRGHPKYNYQYGGGPPPQMSPLAHPGQMSPQGYFAPTSAGSPQGIPPQPMSPQYANSPQNSTLSARHPPPTAPKPNRNSGSFGPDTGPEKPMRQSSVEGPPGKPNGPLRPTLPEDGYRDSPPPPPPPTSTHPLMQSVSRGVPPPGNPGMFGKQVGGIKGPWDRDEKEKYETRKREAARRWRDEQISALENLGSKTPQEEERMNTLKLEREFQRRAEERLHEDDDEDEDEEEDDDDDMDLPKAEIVPPSSSSRPPNGNLGEAQEEDRDKRADEIRRKQRELEAAKEAEERILREAQRRQEEELLRRHHQQQQQQRHQTQATQRLDSLVGAPLNANGTMGNSPRQNYMDHHPPSISPLPPERGSSYSVMHHHQTLETRHSDSAHNRGRPQEAAPVKRVQFSETSPVDTHITYDNNANHEKVSTREDPDDFINEAELMMLSTSPNRGTGNTPGVIGAQEVYRDPRQRRLMEQAQKAAASRGPGPEKLTFREKMKMFAMEAEEGESPKDKMKHSRAQRDIDS